MDWSTATRWDSLLSQQGCQPQAQQCAGQRRPRTARLAAARCSQTGQGLRSRSLPTNSCTPTHPPRASPAHHRRRQRHAADARGVQGDRTAPRRRRLPPQRRQRRGECDSWGGVYVQALHAVVSQRSCAAADAKYVVSRPGHPKYAWRLFCSLPRWRRTLEACIDSCQLTSRTQRFQAATAHAPRCCQSARERAAS